MQLIPVYERVPVTVTDASLPSVLRSLTDRGISVIAMTSRGKGMREVTLDQLNRVNIRFSDLGESRWIDLDEKRKFRIERNGVVFVSHGNKKGEVLARLIEKGFFKDKKQIYLIDDRERHLKDVADVLEKNYPAIKYNPVLCTYLDESKPYNAIDARTELNEFLVKHHDDEVIGTLLRKDDFTKAIARNCFNLIPQRSDDCRFINITKP